MISSYQVYGRKTAYNFDESRIWIGIVPAEDMWTLVVALSFASIDSLFEIVTSVLWVTYEA